MIGIHDFCVFLDKLINGPKVSQYTVVWSMDNTKDTKLLSNNAKILLHDFEYVTQ